MANELLNNILELKLSFQENVWSSPYTSTISEAISFIKSDKYRSITYELRKLYNKEDYEGYSFLKKKLNAVTFCGLFDKSRTKTDLIAYNNLIVIDIDNLDQEKMNEVRAKLLQDKHTFSFWTSPSNHGIKGLIKLDYRFDIDSLGIDQSHKIAFKRLAEYFNQELDIELDNSGSDITRLCFLSFDDSLVLKEVFQPFSVDEVELTSMSNVASKRTKKTVIDGKLKDKLNNPAGKNSPKDRLQIKKIIKYLNKNGLSITYDYNDWIRVAFAIANSFTYDVGLKYFLELSKMDGDKFNHSENERLLQNCYQTNRGQINFNTIVFLAVEEGFKISAKST